MNDSRKKIISISISLLLGIVIVVLSWGVVYKTPNNQNLNWRDSIKIIPTETSSALGMPKANVKLTQSVATTATDMISRKILLEYTNIQTKTATTTISDADASRIANSLASEITLPEKKDYSLKNLNISNDNSLAAGTTYKNALTTILKEHAVTEKTENEVGIFVVGVSTKDEAEMKKLITKAAAYDTLIKKLIALKTPSTIAPLHLKLVQSYETLRVATIGMSKVLTDPAVGIAALTEYRSGVEALSLTEKMYNEFNYTGQ